MECGWVGVYQAALLLFTAFSWKAREVCGSRSVSNPLLLSLVKSGTVYPSVENLLDGGRMDDVDFSKNKSYLISRFSKGFHQICGCALSAVAFISGCEIDFCEIR